MQVSVLKKTQNSESLSFFKSEEYKACNCVFTQKMKTQMMDDMPRLRSEKQIYEKANTKVRQNNRKQVEPFSISEVLNGLKPNSRDVNAITKYQFLSGIP